MEPYKHKAFELSFTCGLIGIDWDDMNLKDYSKKELEYMDSQMNNARLEIQRNLRLR